MFYNVNNNKLLQNTAFLSSYTYISITQLGWPTFKTFIQRVNVQVM